MRTTVDLPDDLFRRAKAEAALSGRKLRDLIEEGLRRVLGESGYPLPSESEGPPSLHQLMEDCCGIVTDVPADYATNPGHLDGFGS